MSAVNDARARMLAGLPITERRMDVGGIATTVLEAGAGPAGPADTSRAPPSCCSTAASNAEVPIGRR